jgi:hypothetical protein
MEVVKGCHNKGSRRLEDEEEDCNKDLETKTQVVANDVVTETELTKIRLVRAFVETHDPSSKVPTYYLISSYSFYFLLKLYNNVCNLK